MTAPPAILPTASPVDEMPDTFRWSLEAYERLVELGVLTTCDPVELVGGEIVTMSPQYSPHAAGVVIGTQVLGKAIDDSHHVRAQVPLALVPDSEPEPDLVVVTGTPRDFVAAHPRSAVLIIEVAESSLRYDRRIKGSLYARAGIPDYWIENLGAGVLEVYRNPVPDPTARFGFSYSEMRTLGKEERIMPLAFPSVSIRVGDLLP